MDLCCHLFLTFLLYSFLGWVCESLYCSIPAGRLINRGFLSGPVCPVYGCGALLVIFLLSPFAGNLPVLFLAAMAVTSGLEYLTGWALETLFHTKWWDYSGHRFQLHGRVCLLNSTLFGLLAVVVMTVLHPLVSQLVDRLQGIALYVTSAALLALFLSDLVTTVVSMVKLSGKLAQLQQLAAELRQRGEAYQLALELDLQMRRELLEEKLEDRLGELRRRREELDLPGAREALDQLSQRMDAYAASLRFPYRRLLEAFPSLRSHRHQGAVDQLRAALERLRTKGGNRR